MKFKFFLFFIFIQFILFYSIDYFYENRKNNILNNKTQIRTQNYDFVLNNFNILANTIFNGYINKKEYNAAFEYGEIDVLRNHIAKYKNYLKSINFYDIHYHTSDNKSFLRMNKRGTNGFDLTKYRHSIVQANKLKKPISGIEIGRLSIYYRYVYPLFDDENEHLGSVENSINANSFINELKKVHDVDISFLVYKKKVDKYVFKNIINDVFKDSKINKDYYLFFDSLHNNKIDYNKLYNEDDVKNIEKRMVNKQAFSLELNNNILASFIPIIDTLNEQLGYFVFYSPTVELKNIKSSKKYLFILFDMIILLLFFIFYKIKIHNKLLEIEVKEKTKELKVTNKNLENIINNEVEKNRKQDLTLMEQSKMAQMGEMIGNIAHQWRQPLSVISTTATSMMINKQINNLSDEKFIENLENINKKSLYLSEIINTFSNFLKNDKNRTTENLKFSILSALNIIGPTIKYNNIEIIKNFENKKDVIVDLIPSELHEIIINILSNAKDALLYKNIKKPIITIDLIINVKNVIITIEDNAGGISEDIIKKIFDPYFTTKHKSQGTGLGLHMSKRIINESLNGKLYVKNTLNGVRFYMELPLIKSN